MKNKKRIMAYLAVMMALVLGTLGISAALAGSLSSEEISEIVDTQTDVSQITSPFIQAVNQVRNSVVGVNNYAMTTSYSYNFGRIYGGQEQEALSATGSGVIISKYGHVLTCYHVVEGASRLAVTISDQELELDAELVGYDEDKDIAVLLVPELVSLNITPAQLGDSDALQVGEWAIIIGNPLGEDFAKTVTAGIVSGLEREVESKTTDKYGRVSTNSNSMIQVDAAINSGNSGGGMFNTLGQLMGIPSMKYSANIMSETTIDNIGMCIPVNVAKDLIEDALNDYDADQVQAALEDKADAETGESTSAKTVRPRIGVTVTTLSSSNSAVAQGVLPNGAYVTNVEEGSPAETAGILVGDIIVEVNETVIASSTELVNELGEYKEGDVLQIKIFRAENVVNAITVDEIGEGEYLDLQVELLIIDDVSM